MSAEVQNSSQYINVSQLQSGNEKCLLTEEMNNLFDNHTTEYIAIKTNCTFNNMNESPDMMLNKRSQIHKTLL